MTGQVLYSFDTSSLLNGQRDLLPPQTFPTVWENIEEMIAAGTVRAIDLVREELAARTDDVTAWARRQPHLFVPLTQDVQLAVRDVLVEHQRILGIGSPRAPRPGGWAPG